MTAHRMGSYGRIWVDSYGRRLAAMALAAGVVASGLALDLQHATAQSLGDLVVSPTRVVFEGRTRSEQIVLANQGAETITYRISLINMAMDEFGNLRTVEEPQEGSPNAAKLIRYAPRAVTIPPGGSQLVRLAVRKPSGLRDGEYRSHMLFRAVPPEDTGVAVDATPQSDTIRIQLIPVYGISIPVIVRHGALDASAGITDLELKRDGEDILLSGNLTRNGNRSVFGDINVDYARNGGESLLIGQLRRLAVYPPLSQRQFNIPLRLPDGVKLQGGTLNVSFSVLEGEQNPVATASLPVP